MEEKTARREGGGSMMTQIERGCEKREKMLAKKTIKQKESRKPNTDIYSLLAFKNNTFGSIRGKLRLQWGRYKYYILVTL